MSTPKEPHFFSTDLRNTLWIRDRSEYLRLFDAARQEHLAVGEASASYLYSDRAATGIKQCVPDARLIVMVRDPVDLFRSTHNQWVASLLEDEIDPERAWRLQRQRAEGRRVPKLCEEPGFLMYSPVCRLGQQLRRLLDVFPEDQIHVVVFDDLKRDARRVYGDVLTFLRLPDDGRTEFPRVHAAHRWRLPFVRRLDHRLSVRLRSPHARWLRRATALVRPIGRFMLRVNRAPSLPSQLRLGFREELVEHFRSDVTLLEGCTGRDLSHWKSLRDNDNR